MNSKYLLACCLIASMALSCNNKNNEVKISSLKEDTTALPKRKWINDNVIIDTNNLVEILRLPIGSKYYISHELESKIIYAVSNDSSSMRDSYSHLTGAHYIWEVESKDTGVYKIKAKLVRMQQTRKGGAWNIDYDSDWEGTILEKNNPGVFKVFWKKLLNQKFTILLDTLGRIKDISELNKIKKLANDSINFDDDKINKLAHKFAMNDIEDKNYERLYEWLFAYTNPKPRKWNESYKNKVISTAQLGKIMDVNYTGYKWGKPDSLFLNLKSNVYTIDNPNFIANKTEGNYTIDQVTGMPILIQLKQIVNLSNAKGNDVPLEAKVLLKMKTKRLL